MIDVLVSVDVLRDGWILFKQDNKNAERFHDFSVRFLSCAQQLREEEALSLTTNVGDNHCHDSAPMLLNEDVPFSVEFCRRSRDQYPPHRTQPTSCTFY